MYDDYIHADLKTFILSSRGGRFGGRGGGRGFRREEGPPSEVVEVGKVLHEVESELLCKLSHATTMVPMFNSGIYLENKTKIGKIDEILGPLTQIMFTVKLDPGVQSKEFKDGDSFYIGTEKLLPLVRFTNPSKPGGGGRFVLMFCFFFFFIHRLCGITEEGVVVVEEVAVVGGKIYSFIIFLIFIIYSYSLKSIPHYTSNLIHSTRGGRGGRGGGRSFGRGFGRGGGRGGGRGRGRGRF